MPNLISIPGVTVLRNNALVPPPELTPGNSLFVSASDTCWIVAENTALFRVSSGNLVEYKTYAGYDTRWLSLHMGGRVLAALLHQRGTINFHAGCIVAGGKGIMIAGDTGAGKSTLSAASALYGEGYISDDLTAIEFRDSSPYAIALGGEARINSDTLKLLNIKNGEVAEGEPGSGKYYIKRKAVTGEVPLAAVLFINRCNDPEYRFASPDPVNSFSFLRSNICMWEILAAMPSTEASYMQQLLEIIKRVPVAKLEIPAAVPPDETLGKIKEYFLNGK
jgi:hypothetical protein